MAKGSSAKEIVVAPFPPDIAAVKREVDVTEMTSDSVMSKVRLLCDSDTVVVFFRREEKLYFAPSEKVADE